jgi:hypothetical protein
MGDLGKTHQIHVAMNHHQEKHQSTMLETSGTITNPTLSILIDPSATKSFIFGTTLERIKVKEIKQDEFSFL